MLIYENDLSAFPRNDNSVVTVGTFDGLHLGHRKLIERVVASGSPSTVLTFYPHPQMVVARPGAEIKILTSPDEKVKGLEQLGIERLVVLKFNRDLLNFSAEEFLREIVVQRIGVSKMVVGYDHAFGKDRKGNKDFLESQAKKYNFQLEIVEPYYYQGLIVSSTRIRRALAQGDIALASAMLGRNYCFEGWVVKGDSRGATLGYPTANLSIVPAQMMIPADGVYAVFVQVKGQKLPAMLYLGTRPTYGSGELSVEVFIMDFKNTIYGEKICVEVVEFLRKDQVFQSSQELTAQMQKDEKQARTILKTL